MHPTVEDAKLIEFWRQEIPHSVLSVYDHPRYVPFPIARVFVVDAQQAANRGEHAHRECEQLLVCLRGKIIVTVDDARNRKTLTLDRSDRGLYLPPGLWGEQAYEAGSLLMTLASHVYDEADYIRDYEDFVRYRGV